MNTYRMIKIIVAALLLSIPAGMNLARGDEPAVAKSDSLEQIAAACQEAKANFRPLSNDDLKSVKADLVMAVGKLDKRLKSAGPNGDEWRKFLLWETLDKQLQQEGMPNRERLTEVYQRYASGHEGLALEWFVDVQSALRRLLMIMGSIDNPQTKTLYEQNLDKLAAQLKAYAAAPTTDGALEISESVRWLKNARQTPELIRAIEQRFNQPNLFVEVSAQFINAGLGEPVDDVTEVRDCILGTTIHGSGHTVGQTTAELVTDDNRGVIDTMLFATTQSSTIGYHGPVCIYSNSTTRIGACKRLWIDEYGIFAHPAVSNACTQTCIADIVAKRAIIERIAWKKAGKQLSAAESIASSHAEQRVNDRVDSKAAEQLDQAQSDFNKKIRKPLVEHKLFPELLKFSTDNQSLHVVSMLTGNPRLASPTPPPVTANTDLVLRIHESMINNFAFDALSGMTVHEEKLQAAVIDMLGKLPDKLKGDEDQEPWAITFARRQPISVTFADGGFKITIHGSEYFKGENGYPAMNVTAVYKIEKSDAGFKAVRQGDIQIFPPGRTQVGGKEQIIRNLLMKRFEKVFEPEFIGKGFLLTGKWEKVGTMSPVDVQCNNGWLTIAWRRTPAEPKIN